MQAIPTLTATTPQQLWQQIEAELQQRDDLLSYQRQLNLNGTLISLDIDIDLGGGFESGIETTRIKSTLPTAEGYSFDMHHQGLLEEIGKFFGMQDVEVGDPEFDKNVIVKTNDEEQTRQLLEKGGLKHALSDLHDFSFSLSQHSDSDTSMHELVLEVLEGLSDPKRLEPVFKAFVAVITHFNPQTGFQTNLPHHHQ